ncbi:DUF350 domain-containing protein [Clostridiaceae bacterium WCA-383-APC-5B]|uniref:DUF350 domain-containing protein n=2 Tax=Inconstantimicrobium porci TaxID=2652291 RepID=A0A7X2MZ71_9CLOT|nr:DUF350 domain-containing protein [Inconstantimicrobium porci]
MMDILGNLGISFLFGLLGIIIMVIGYVIFDKVIPADFNKELEKGNTAVAIVIAGMLIGIALIVSKVVA